MMKTYTYNFLILWSKFDQSFLYWTKLWIIESRWYYICTTNFSSVLIGWIEKFLNLCPIAKRM